jgi:hypothetical protein
VTRAPSGLSADDVRRIRESPVFEVTRSSYLVVDRDLCIRAANPSYQRATGKSQDELVGRSMFDAFPPNPDDPTDDGASRLQESFARVLSRNTRDYMGLQRYDIPGPAPERSFVFKVWAPVNSPLVDVDGRPAGILHHVEDLTRSLGRDALARVGDGPVGPDLQKQWQRLVTALDQARAAHRHTQEQFETLQHALASNRQIATAVGILMASNNLDRGGAFQMLVRLSQRAGTKLRDVAADVVTAFEDAPRRLSDESAAH